MISLAIEDQHRFMAELLTGSAFDRFLCVKAEIARNVTWSIDGRLNVDFFDSDKQQAVQAQEYAGWVNLKSTVYQIVQGKQAPLGMSLVLKLSGESTSKLIESSGTSLTQDQVGGLFINVHYNSDGLNLTTGSSASVFTMDRSLDHSFEELIQKLLADSDIAFSKL